MKAIDAAFACVAFLAACLVTLAAEDPAFTADQLKLPGKKGACFTPRQTGSKSCGTIDQNMPRVIALNVSWNYSWGLDLVPEQQNWIAEYAWFSLLFLR